MQADQKSIEEQKMDQLRLVMPMGGFFTSGSHWSTWDLGLEIMEFTDQILSRTDNRPAIFDW